MLGFAFEGLPPKRLLGTTIETNTGDAVKFSRAPHPIERYEAMANRRENERVFLTIEPIMDFDLSVMVSWIKGIRPDFVNVGADSKGHHLPEPSADKVRALIDGITRAGIEIRKKSNLERILG